MSAKYDEIKKELLNDLCSMLIDENIAAKYTGAGEEGYPLQTVNALIDEMTERGTDGIGEFFFMPEAPNAEEYGVFQAIVTFEEELNAATRAVFDKVASVINFYLETGAFCGDADNSNYSLKISVMMPLEADTDTLKRIVRLNASQAILTATAYCNLFIKVAAGEMQLDEVEALVKG